MESEWKFCTKCNQNLPLESFSFKNKAKGTRSKRCKTCIAQVSKAHYERNVQNYVIRSKARNEMIVQENRAHLFEYLSSHPCADCGNNDIRVLEFDHVQKKSGNIARMVSEGFSWSTISAEIAKCEVRCANCHRIKTDERGGFWRGLFKTSSDQKTPDQSGNST